MFHNQPALLLLVTMVSVFALIVFVNGGGVRHVSIFWKEKIEASVAFRNVNGELKVVGRNGITRLIPHWFLELETQHIFLQYLIRMQHHMYFTSMVD